MFSDVNALSKSDSYSPLMAVRMIIACYDTRFTPKRLVSVQPFVLERDSLESQAIGLQTLGQEGFGEC